MRGTGVTAAGLALANGTAVIGRAGAAEARSPAGEGGPGGATAFTSLGFARMRGEGCLAYVGQGFVEEAELLGSVLGAARPGAGRHVAVRTPAAMEERAVRMLGSAPAAADPDSALVVARSSGTDWVVLGDLEISFCPPGPPAAGVRDGHPLGGGRAVDHAREWIQRPSPSVSTGAAPGGSSSVRHPTDSVSDYFLRVSGEVIRELTAAEAAALRSSAHLARVVGLDAQADDVGQRLANLEVAADEPEADTVALDMAEIGRPVVRRAHAALLALDALDDARRDEIAQAQVLFTWADYHMTSAVVLMAFTVCRPDVALSLIDLPEAGTVGHRRDDPVAVAVDRIGRHARAFGDLRAAHQGLSRCLKDRFGVAPPDAAAVAVQEAEPPL